MSSSPTTSAVPFAANLAFFGDRPAFLTSSGTVTYAALAERVRAVAEQLGTTRRLVLVAGANELEPIVVYLAALAAGHPVVLVPGDNEDNLRAMEAAYDPDVVFCGGRLRVRREGSAHDLHPRLALLLSTSGSTGSPKLVRLSARSVQANAESIAGYLGIRSTDVAATTLPMHYCYGLSVIHSHLLAGASLLLTSLSVTDGCFWDLVRRHAVTCFAGVPYTFELLERVGFADMDIPSLRYLTQAGGRLARSSVLRFAELGQRRGFDLFVMYGQTEATARMTYLPPDLVRSAPESIGVPIPGGSIRLEPLPEAPLSRSEAAAAPEVGELVYSGENVMLGYAESPADLARGREVRELWTGDVARRTPDGLYQVIGRRNRFAKVLGLRIDLDRVETMFAAAGRTASCADAGDRIVVAVDPSVPADAVSRIVRDQIGLPPAAVAVCPVAETPRLPTGKPDYRAIAALATRPSQRGAETGAGDGTEPRPEPTDAAATRRRLREVYGEVLHRPDVNDDDTFVALGGDSLSYVETSIRVEKLLGHLPAEWHRTPIRALVPAARPAASGVRSVETNVALRAVATVLIVGSHANLFTILGGAHVLLGVAGYNFGRFQLTGARHSDRLRRMVVSLLRIVVPSVLWIGLAALLFPGYPLRTVLLLNGALGPPDWSEPAWYYWFVEALVYTLLGLTVLMAVPLVDRIERRWPFWLPFGLALAGLVTRYQLVVLRGGDVIHRAHIVFWLFALGWAAAKARTNRQRLLVSLVLATTVWGFFDDPAREAVVVAGMLLLVWVRSLPVPTPLARLCGVLASASLYVYLVQWQIYPYLEDRSPLLATSLSLAAGVAFWQLVIRIRLPRARRPLRRVAGCCGDNPADLPRPAHRRTAAR